MPKSDEDLRNLILARRARFVAAAMGTSGVLSSCVNDAEPSVCLSPPFMYSTESTSSDTSPRVCLSPLDSDTMPTTSATFPSVCLEPAWTSAKSTDPTDAGADAGDVVSTKSDERSSTAISDTALTDGGGAEPAPPSGPPPSAPPLPSP